MPTRYDIWKTASPPEYDLECCEECWVESHRDVDDDLIPDHCGDEDCFCHSTDDGDAAYDAMKDDQLTGD